jgi:PleD family two-component response regulator
VAQTKRYTVVVADDTQPQVEALASVIRDAPEFKVSTAIGVEHALRVSREMEPDVIIVNIARPAQTIGWSLIDALKRDTALRTVPVILLVNEGTAADRERARRAGVNSFFTSWLPAELFREIKSMAR